MMTSTNLPLTTMDLDQKQSRNFNERFETNQPHTTQTRWHQQTLKLKFRQRKYHSWQRNISFILGRQSSNDEQGKEFRGTSHVSSDPSFIIHEYRTSFANQHSYAEQCDKCTLCLFLQSVSQVSHLTSDWEATQEVKCSWVIYHTAMVQEAGNYSEAYWLENA